VLVYPIRCPVKTKSKTDNCWDFHHTIIAEQLLLQ
jgi:hypothetical protein